MKKLLLAVSMYAIAFTMNAQTSTWDGTTEAFDTDEKGTSENPIEIINAAQLAYLAQEVNITPPEGGDYKHFKDVYFKLMTDIDLNNHEWTPIGGMAEQQEGDSPRSFQGIFDGNGHTIANLKISESTNFKSSIGLFGYIGLTAQIMNLGIVSGEVAGNDRVGAIVGRMTSATTSNRSKIINCYNKANVTVAKQEAGGIVAWAGGDIINCYNMGTISCKDGGNGNIAGVAGKSAWPAYNVEQRNLYNCGQIIGMKNCYSLIAAQAANPPAKLINSYFNSDINEGMAGISWNNENVKAKTSEEMKSASFIDELNGGENGFMADLKNINNGYPVLNWENSTLANIDNKITENPLNIYMKKNIMHALCSEPSNIMVYEVTGNCIYKEMIKEKLSLQLQPGIYIIKVKNGEYDRSIKVIANY